MKTFTMPGTDITAPNVTLGLMRIQDKTDDEVRTLIRTAREAAAPPASVVRRGPGRASGAGGGSGG